MTEERGGKRTEREEKCYQCQAVFVSIGTSRGACWNVVLDIDTRTRYRANKSLIGFYAAYSKGGKTESIRFHVFYVHPFTKINRIFLKQLGPPHTVKYLRKCDRIRDENNFLDYF